MSQLKLHDAKKRLNQLAEESTPHQLELQKMAQEAITIQEGVIAELLNAQYPGLAVEELNIVGSISSRNNIDDVEKALAHLKEQGIVVERVIYDKIRYQFLLIGGAK